MKATDFPMDFFSFTTYSPNFQKIMKKKKLSVKLLDLIMDIKQVITLTFKLKLPIICPYPLMNFMILYEILTAIWLITILIIFH